jgi:mannosyltransferase OCH1-like enzyme
MTIQKNIFQTHKSLRHLVFKKKYKILNAMKTWNKYSKMFNYQFFNDEMCNEFMKQNFDEKTNKAYSMLPMAVMKADLWRYCVLYKYGGIYADTDTVCNINPIIFVNKSFMTVAPEPTHNYFCQWSFAAPSGSPILKSIIDLSVERILNTEIKGEHIIHYLTGPACFTDGIVKYLKENNLPTFENIDKYYNYPSHILAVFDKNNFHNKFIKHLYAGSDNDGWKSERKSILI